MNKAQLKKRIRTCEQTLTNMASQDADLFRDLTPKQVAERCLHLQQDAAALIVETYGSCEATIVALAVAPLIKLEQEAYEKMLAEIERIEQMN